VTPVERAERTATITSGTRSPHFIGAAPTARDLPNHIQDPCPFCDDGRYDADEEGNVDENATCDNCDSERWFEWTAYGQQSDIGHCDHCKRDDIEIHIFDDQAICMRCIIACHRAWCGCALWRKWEAWDQDPITQMGVALDAAKDAQRERGGEDEERTRGDREHEP